MKGSDISAQLEVYLKTNEQKIYRMAYSYTHNDADAKDMIQNAIIKAFRSRSSLSRQEGMEIWFYRILVNTCLDHLRSKRRRSFFPIDENLPDQQNHHDELLLHEELWQLLKQLDDKTRTILVLRYFEERQLQEIASILKLPLSTVKTRLYKGLQELRIQIKEQDL